MTISSFQSFKAPHSRRINDSLFSTWAPKMAYLLGQFKAGLNFSINKNSVNQRKGYIRSATITTTNLQHLIKLQLLLGSNHRILCDLKHRERYNKNESLRFLFNFRNQRILEDLKRFGFQKMGSVSPKNNAPFPKDIPDELMPHFIRGYFDERCCPYVSNGRPALSISGADKKFLADLSLTIFKKLGISERTIHTKRYLLEREEEKSYFIAYSGRNQLPQIFKFLYLFVPSSLYCIERYSRFCKIMGYEEDYVNIDVDLDVKSLYRLHEFCCKKRIDPNVLAKSSMRSFLLYCRKNDLLPKDKSDLIEEGKAIAMQFRFRNEKSKWHKVFGKFYESYISEQSSETNHNT